METDVKMTGDKMTLGNVHILNGTEYDNAPDLMDLAPEDKIDEAEEKPDFDIDRFIAFFQFCLFADMLFLLKLAILYTWVGSAE